MKTFNITKDKIKQIASFVPGNNTYRDIQKTIDFLIPYGGGPDKISEQFNIPIHTAKQIVADFFRACPKVRKFLQEKGQFTRDNGYSRTPSPISRIRWFKEHARLHSMDSYSRNKTLSEMERGGANMVVQGCCADIVKIAMVKTRNHIRDNNLFSKVKQVLQVHDELVDDVDSSIVKEWAVIKRTLMLEAGEVIIKNVPMDVSISIEDKWAK